MNLPGPSTFKEAQSLFYGRFIVWAGVALGLGGAILVGILTWGGWPEALYGKIIDILGRVLMGAGVLMALIVAFLGLGGPVRALKLALGKFSFDTQGDEDCGQSRPE